MSSINHFEKKQIEFMNAMNFFSVIFITIVYLLKLTFGKIISDNLKTNINWIYLTKFHFHPIDGHIDVNLEIGSGNVQAVDDVMKFDVLSKEEWKNGLAKICLKKELGLIQGINETNLWSLSTSFTSINRMYVVLSQCNSSLDASLSYKVILTNGKNLFTEQFSNDERGILILFIVSTSIYTIFLLMILRYIYLSKKKSCLIIKFYFTSILCSWLNSFITFIFTLIFAFTGNSETFFYRLLFFLARLSYFTAQILFLLTLILCAKGYLIFRIQLKKKTMFKIKFLMLLYILLQIIILVLITIFTNRVIFNENILLVCDYIQMVMYLLSCFWFILSLVFTTEGSNKELYFFLSFSIWFLTNAVVILLNILDVLPQPRITISRIIEISIQFLSYCIFRFLIRSETFFLRTKLNQINITYIDPTMKEQSKSEREMNPKSNELTNLCFIEKPWTSRLPMPINSLGPPPRLEPRREMLSKTLTNSSVISSQPSICHVPRRLIPLNHDDQ